MSFQFGGTWMIPGIQQALETAENHFWWGRWENQIWASMILDGSSRDTGHSVDTVLRPGLLLGMVEATGKVKQWNPAATDGTQHLMGILGAGVTTQRMGINQDRWMGFVMVGGTVKADRLLIPGQSNFGISGIATEHLVRSHLYPRFMTSDWYTGNPFGGWKSVRAVGGATTAYTVTEAENGTLFTNRGNTGNINFTLPATPKAGLRYMFYTIAAGTLTVTAGTAGTMIAHNDASADSVAKSTASHIIGNAFEVIGDGTSWLVLPYGSGAVTVA
jgi:hypothetical protein